MLSTVGIRSLGIMTIGRSFIKRLKLLGRPTLQCYYCSGFPNVQTYLENVPSEIQSSVKYIFFSVILWDRYARPRTATHRTTVYLCLFICRMFTVRARPPPSLGVSEQLIILFNSVGQAVSGATSEWNLTKI